jgi:predicted acylesterase/phospholipase RssA
MPSRKSGQSLLLGCLSFALVLAFGSGPVEAKSEKKKEKKAAKQHSNVHDLEKRDLSPAQLEAMRAAYTKTVAEERGRMMNTALRRLEREYRAHQQTGAPFVRDILIISGGGAKGAFGAGFLQGWESVKGSTALPEFDVVTGVSTGALIAPFAFIGTEAATTSVVDFYANPDKNWVHKRGMLYIKPGHVSLFNDDVLQEMIRNSVDEALVEAIAEGVAEDRMLQIGATNLDLGIGRIFDMGHEATKAVSSGSRDRIHSILLASSAIPAVFPPVVIDDLWYGDGGAAANLTLFVSPGFNATWRALHPKAPLPKYRIWIVVNQQLRIEPAVTMPSWVSVAGRGLDTVTHSLQLFAMHLLAEIIEDYQATEGMDIEFRWVAIPEDAPKPGSKDMFDKDYMLALEELGRKMGADPSVWKTEVPLVYSFE